VRATSHGVTIVDSDSIVDAVDESTLIFEATVLSHDTAAVMVDSSLRRIMQAHVGQVLRTPEAMGDFDGDTVTIISRDSAGLAPGSHAVFFSYGLVAGTTLVVQEVLRIGVASDSDVVKLRPRITRADSVLIDRAIVANGTIADAVVLVRVDSVVPVSVPDSLARRGSEHTPRWKQALATVTRSFRPGDSTLVNHMVRTLFAAGGTSLTEDAPQLQVGDSRILWLHRLSRLDGSLRAGIDTIGRYFVIEADHARPASDSSRVARLLLSPR
jgi:hypothetical protein